MLHKYNTNTEWKYIWLFSQIPATPSPPNSFIGSVKWEHANISDTIYNGALNLTLLENHIITQIYNYPTLNFNYLTSYYKRQKSRSVSKKERDSNATLTISKQYQENCPYCIEFWMAENVKIFHFCPVSAFDSLHPHFSDQRLDPQRLATTLRKLLYSLLSLMMSKAIVMLPFSTVHAIFRWL